MQEPGKSDPCERCRHRFGMHFTTYDGRISGCSFTREQRANDARNDRAVGCFCLGFATIQVWAPPASPAPGGLGGEVTD